jgi:hypothetical protein
MNVFIDLVPVLTADGAAGPRFSESPGCYQCPDTPASGHDATRRRLKTPVSAAETRQPAAVLPASVPRIRLAAILRRFRRSFLLPQAVPP